MKIIKPDPAKVRCYHPELPRSIRDGLRSVWPHDTLARCPGCSCWFVLTRRWPSLGQVGWTDLSWAQVRWFNFGLQARIRQAEEAELRERERALDRREGGL